MKCEKCGTEYDGNECPVCQMKIGEETKSNQEEILKNVDEEKSEPKKKGSFWIWATIEAITAILLVVCLIKWMNLSSENTELKRDYSAVTSDYNKVKVEYSNYKTKMSSYEDLEESEAEARKIEADKVVEQKKAEDEAKAQEEAEKQRKAEEEAQKQASLPMEYKNALAKAESYSTHMHMSKQGIYDQLTSAYGEGFTAEAAQYAVDNLQADYKQNALEKAKSYQSNMNMSLSAIKEQLMSEYGEQFTEEEAQYAIENLQ